MAGDYSQILKQQMLMSAGMNQQNSGGLSQVIYGMILMTVIDNLMKLFPGILQWISLLVEKFIKSKKDNVLSLIEKDTSSSIVFHRNYDVPGSEENDTCDALIHYICKQNSVLKLKFQRRYFLNNREPFQLSKNVTCNLMSMETDDKKDCISKITFELKSKELNLLELRDFVNGIVHEYNVYKQNKLGDSQYYFNEIVTIPPKNPDGKGYRLEMASPKLTFTMTEFNTNKSLNNVFGPELETVKNRINLFVNNPEWYKKRGIPYTLGILLHGEPGTGKTSTIKAIAGDTKRHIINISLRKSTTQQQLTNLFYNENILINSEGETKTITIPLNKRIYVIEDADCLSDVVLDRSLESSIEIVSVKETPIESLENSFEYSEKPKDKKVDPLSQFFGGIGDRLEESYEFSPIISEKNTSQYLEQKSNNDINRLIKFEEYKQALGREMTTKDADEFNKLYPSVKEEEKTEYEKIDPLSQFFGDISKHANPKPIQKETKPQYKGITPEEKLETLEIVSDINPFGRKTITSSESRLRSIKDMERATSRISNRVVDMENFKKILGKTELSEKDMKIFNHAYPETKTRDVSGKNSVPHMSELLTESIDTQENIPNMSIKPLKKVKKVSESNLEDSYALNLSFLLNLLDGVLETPGRILIMTSNYPEKLDRALTRPGRIDITIKFGLANFETLRKMFNHFFELNDSQSEFKFNDTHSNKITPAKVSQILSNNYLDKSKAYSELMKELN